MLNSSVSNRFVGYFSYSVKGHVFCDGDACIIAGTEALMYSYIRRMMSHHKKKDIVKQTRFDEVINGLKKGGAYAFDKDAYDKFLYFAEEYGLDDLPDPNHFFSEPSPTGLHFIRIQLHAG